MPFWGPPHVKMRKIPAYETLQALLDFPEGRRLCLTELRYELELPVLVFEIAGIEAHVPDRLLSAELTTLVRETLKKQNPRNAPSSIIIAFRRVAKAVKTKEKASD